MSEQPKLSDAEWALIVELLHQERDQLPVYWEMVRMPVA